MRRIYDSEALERDDDQPHAPRERRRRSYAPRAIRSVDFGGLFGRLLPERLRRRAIRVHVATPREAYGVGEPVPFTVVLRNALPVPVAIRTPTPVAWTWTVDGHVEASRVAPWDPPAEPGVLEFGGGERKRFEREWSGLFRTAEDEWAPAEPGEHRLGVAVGPDVGSGSDRGDGRNFASGEADPARNDGNSARNDGNSARNDGTSARNDGNPARADGSSAWDGADAPSLAASTAVRVVRE